MIHQCSGSSFRDFFVKTTEESEQPFWNHFIQWTQHAYHTQHSVKLVWPLHIGTNSSQFTGRRVSVLTSSDGLLHLQCCKRWKGLTFPHFSHLCNVTHSSWIWSLFVCGAPILFTPFTPAVLTTFSVSDQLFCSSSLKFMCVSNPVENCQHVRATWWWCIQEVIVASCCEHTHFCSE